MKNGRIASTRHDKTVYLRLAGRLTFVLSTPLDNFVGQAFQSPPEYVVIDMNEAEHVDSTMLGLLAKIARLLKTARDRTPTIHVRTGDVSLLIETMGFDEVFELKFDEELQVEGYVDIEGTPEDGAPTTETLLEAHQLLMDLNEKNRESFRTTVEMLRKDRDAS